MDEPSAASPQSPPQARVLRARSLPSAGPFRVAAVFFALHCLGLIGALTALYGFILEPTETASRILLGCMAFSALTWLISFFKRRSAHCPLCKGTPLANSGARTHLRAKRLLPFNHGVTATLSILAAQRFRCMYCGSDFDLLKPPSRPLRGTDDGRPAETPPAA
jgi:hypothetical protein